MAKITNREIKKYWKYPCPKDRFGYDEDSDGNWQLVDRKYGMLLMAPHGKGWETVKMAWFARNYVRIHGDIDFRSFPYSLFQALDYAGGEKPEEVRSYAKHLVPS